jgi:SAM-dependent methyltransferase
VPEYALPNRAAAAGARHAALAELFDGSTLRHLDALGLATGWRCWEVGAGGSALVRALAARVGSRGRVLATDLDLAQLGPIEGVETRVHDVARDAPPDGPFDLVHARLVLVHVPDRERALAAMAGALAPGGWLVIEDADPLLQPLACLDPRGEADELANRLRLAFRALLTARGADLAFGRSLPRRLREAGLDQIGADAYFPVAHPALAALERATIAMTGAQLVAAGAATDAELARHLASLDAGQVAPTTSPMITAWARRPHAT